MTIRWRRSWITTADHGWYLHPTTFLEKESITGRTVSSVSIIRSWRSQWIIDYTPQISNTATITHLMEHLRWADTIYRLNKLIIIQWKTIGDMRGVNVDCVSCSIRWTYRPQTDCAIYMQDSYSLSNTYMALIRALFTGRWLGIKSLRN